MADEGKSSLLDLAGTGSNKTGGDGKKGEGEGEGKGQEGQGEGGDGAGAGGGKGDGGEGGKGAGEGGGEGGKKDGEGKAGAGEKPEWLTEDKFWDKTKGELNAELLFKNYADARTKLSRGDQKPPEAATDYKVDIDPKDAALIGMAKPSEDPLVKWFQAAAHKIGLGQDSFNEIVGGYVEFAKGMIPNYDPETEIKSLGADGQKIVDELALWGNDLHEKGILSDADKGELWALAGTADGIRLIQTLRKHFGDEPIPPRPGEGGEGLPSRAELSAMLASEKYASDAAYREKVDALYEKVYGSQPAGTSI